MKRFSQLAFACLALTACDSQSPINEYLSSGQQKSALSTGLRYDDMEDVGSFVVDSRRWDHTNLTYFFQNATSDIPRDNQRAAIGAAMELWTARTPLRFTEVYTAASADIVILWATGDHGDGSNFDGVNGVLAHAFYPPPNRGSLAGDLHFDDDETWTDSSRTDGRQPIDLVTVAAHELGHALGLAHSTDTSALMYPYYGQSHRFLSTDDVNGIHAIYGDGIVWNRIGGANCVTGMTAWNNKIFASNCAGELWVRDPVLADIGWSKIDTASGVVGMAALGGKLFAATSDNKFWARDAVTTASSWTYIGGANNVTGLTALGGKLFASAKDNALWVRDPVLSDVPWTKIGGANNVTAMTSASGKLYATAKDNLLWNREPVLMDAAWSIISSANNVTGMAVVGSNLFAADTSNGLWVRPLGP